MRALAKLRGGGSAIPGRVAMLIEPKLLEKTLASLQHGVVFVSGSNGKSTTTALVAATLESQGLRVFSNPSGGNMPQGIASAVVGKSNLKGQLAADIAVLEVDEAYGELLAKHFRPAWVVLTNIQIDQLNRFFEPERVYGMLLRAAASATKGVVINGSDANLIALGSELGGGLKVLAADISEQALTKWPSGALAAPRFSKETPRENFEKPVRVLQEQSGNAEFEIDGKKLTSELPGSGLHFAVDTALAFSLGIGVLGAVFDAQKAADAVSQKQTVYGRGEIASYQGVEIQILMMKNPASMRATLVAMPEPETSVWFAMDEGTPDPSWLYDIDLSRLGKIYQVSGSRCWHLATRLGYAAMPPEHVIPDSKQALSNYVQHLQNEGKRGTLITNYEQMMEIRKAMGFLDLESGK